MPSAAQCRQQFRLACLPGAGAQVEVQLTSLSAVNPTKVLLGSGSGAVLLEAGALGRVGRMQGSNRGRSGLQTLGVGEHSTCLPAGMGAAGGISGIGRRWPVMCTSRRQEPVHAFLCRPVALAGAGRPGAAARLRPFHACGAYQLRHRG